MLGNPQLLQFSRKSILFHFPQNAKKRAILNLLNARREFQRFPVKPFPSLPRSLSGIERKFDPKARSYD